MQKKSSQTLLVWDTVDQLPMYHDDVLYWQSYEISASEGVFSVQQLIEKSDKHLRTKYLTYIYDLGETRINGKRVIDHLELRPGFSYWWMTLLTEKCNYAKSPQIDNVIKVLALRDWLIGKEYSRINLVSSDYQLAEAIKLFALEMKLDFSLQRLTGNSENKPSIKYFYHFLPEPIKAIVWFFHHFITHWPLKGTGVLEWQKSKASSLFVSYMSNLVPNAAKHGRFESRYWESLPEMLNAQGHVTNWLHIYVKDELVQNTTEAASLIDNFNQTHEGNQVHATLHSFLSIKIIIKVMQDWFKLLRCWKSISFDMKNIGGYLWPLLRGDFHNSVLGNTALSNLLNLNLFESAMGQIQNQNIGFYLQENQGWEFGFIHAWESQGHGSSLIGVPHSTIRFWDLRYFYSQQSYERKGQCDLPLPAYVGINGSAAKKMYLHGGYPKDHLIEVEALRYLHLADTKHHNPDSVTSGREKKTVLVLGDYLKENTAQQMELLSVAAQFIDKPIQYLVKSHPACPIREEDYPELHMEVVNDSISSLIDRCSVAYTGNVTSAAVDAYCAGKPVVTILDPNTLNLSPLKDCEGVTFVFSSQELVQALNEITLNEQAYNQGKDYFYIDRKLPRWKKVLSMNES